MRRGLPSAGLALLLLPLSRAAGQERWAAAARLTFTEHRVDAGFGVERFSGLGLGIDGARRFGRLTVGIVAQGTHLAARTSNELDRRLGEVGASVNVSVGAWWGFYGGLSARSIASDAARQHWLLGRVGLEARPPFTGARAHAIGRLGIMPIATLTGLSSASPAVDGSVGVDYAAGDVRLALLYGVERFAFPALNGIRRSEQFSTLSLRAGVALR